mmetsp:Transcript_13884/g.26149  ORF Transcript_13884/g.26149 Transcript_13884/m.26149 type:complete len:209 (+) Transcript_13884:819-1445(+)
MQHQQLLLLTLKIRKWIRNQKSPKRKNRKRNHRQKIQVPLVRKKEKVEVVVVGKTVETRVLAKAVAVAAVENIILNTATCLNIKKRRMDIMVTIIVRKRIRGRRHFYPFVDPRKRQHLLPCPSMEMHFGMTGMLMPCQLPKLANKCLPPRTNNNHNDHHCHQQQEHHDYGHHPRIESIQENSILPLEKEQLYLKYYPKYVSGQFHYLD